MLLTKANKNRFLKLTIHKRFFVFEKCTGLVGKDPPSKGSSASSTFSVEAFHEETKDLVGV